MAREDHLGRQSDRAVVYIRHRLDPADVALAARLEIDALPNAAVPRIPAHLLAGGLMAGGDVGGLDGHGDLFAGFGELAEVHIERQVAADVLTRQTAVDPNLGLPVARPHHQPGVALLPARSLGQTDLPRVPGSALVLRVADAAELALPGKGHSDPPGEGVVDLEPALVFALVLRVEFKGPSAIEADPRLAAEVRPGMLGPGSRPVGGEGEEWTTQTQHDAEQAFGGDHGGHPIARGGAFARWPDPVGFRHVPPWCRRGHRAFVSERRP